MIFGFRTLMFRIIIQPSLTNAVSMYTRPLLPRKPSNRTATLCKVAVVTPSNTPITTCLFRYSCQRFIARNERRYCKSSFVFRPTSKKKWNHNVYYFTKPRAIHIMNSETRILSCLNYLFSYDVSVWSFMYVTIYNDKTKRIYAPDRIKYKV